MRKTGKIVSWKTDRGFGFIAPSDGDRQLFVHVNALDRALLPPSVGAEVSYVVSADSKGRARAEDVELIRNGIHLGPAFWSFLAASLFLTAVAAICVLGIFPLVILWLYLGASILTFVVYALDKSAAEAGRWRTKEDTLHLLALVGGWPGALFAQQLLRHKSSKRSFRMVYWITVAINLSSLGYLASDEGRWILEIFGKMEI